jgi:copper chaperone CopZ
MEVVHGNHKTETLKVYGNCGMCEKTIEGSLKNIKGIEKADWNKETKMMEVTFDSEVISLKEIKQKIADVGYDTDEVRATDDTYNGLPGCCQYERPESKNEEHNHNHKH